MSTRAKATGALGVVIDGRMRDVREHWDLGFPVCRLPTASIPSLTDSNND